MNCPYCNNLMEIGVITSPHEINWKPKSRFLGAAMFSPDSVILSEFSFVKGSCVKANLCRGCKKVIIEYED